MTAENGNAQAHADPFPGQPGNEHRTLGRRSPQSSAGWEESMVARSAEVESPSDSSSGDPARQQVHAGSACQPGNEHRTLGRRSLQSSAGWEESMVARSAEVESPSDSSSGDQTRQQVGAGTARWVDKRERMPMEEDCDAQGCVLAWHKFSGADVVSLHVFRRFGTMYSHWMRTPEGPGK